MRQGDIFSLVPRLTTWWLQSGSQVKWGQHEPRLEHF